MEIAVIGSSMVDLIAYTDVVPKAGETLEAKEFQMGCGGKGANQAVMAARLGAQVIALARTREGLEKLDDEIKSFNGLSPLHLIVTWTIFISIPSIILLLLLLQFLLLLFH